MSEEQKIETEFIDLLSNIKLMEYLKNNPDEMIIVKASDEGIFGVYKLIKKQIINS